MRICHWFRSDLRVDDNTALRAAAKSATELHLLYVLDAELRFGPRCGEARWLFLTKNLEELSRSLEERGQVLHVERGKPLEVLARLQSTHRFDRFTWNRDYSPFAKTRDGEAARLLQGRGATVTTYKDRVLFESEEVLTQQGTAYSVFTPYRRTWQKLIEERLEASPAEYRLPKPLVSEKAPQDHLRDPGRENTTRENTTGENTARENTELASSPGDGNAAIGHLPPAGEAAAQSRLTSFLQEDAARYSQQRDVLALQATSRLSPYLRLGVVSARRCLRDALEAQSDVGAAQGLQTWIHQLIWRDFYSAVLDRNPHVLKRAHKKAFENIAWENDQELFGAWCAGETGFPLVDAGMRELNATGFMHNRARMVTASFLTKDLLVDWRWGERYFMQKLVDGDPANNNGGWQWAASTGTDAQPYFRIFNPVSQSRKFDPEGNYIRRWVPELAGISAPTIHEPWKRPLETSSYTARVIDHAERRLVALQLFKQARASG